MSFKRNVYLKTLPLPEAVAKVLDALTAARSTLQGDARAPAPGKVLLPAQEAVGRVLYEAVHARYSSPTCHAAAMDGYAVRAADTFDAREGESVLLREGETCFAVNTGHPLPEVCDAVIMIEHVAVDNKGGVSVEAPAFPWQHVRRIGEDIVATELLFPRNHQIRPCDVGALLSSGIWEVPVWEQVLVRIIPTGDEVLDFEQRPDPGRGQVVESNSQVLAALARELGCRVERVKPVPDQPEQLRAALRDSLDAGAHVVIFCAGSSAGSKDYTRSILESEGEILVHGIAAMPGKPSLAAICRGRPVFGAPGYPVSSLICFEELITPAICLLAHRPLPARPEIEVELTRSLSSRLGLEEFVHLAVGRVGEKAVGIPLNRGAGNISTVTRAQAVMRIPAEAEGAAEGSLVRARLSVPPARLYDNLICVGSHDNVLDLLADELMGLPHAFRLISAHVGSMGGITALKKNVCHMAGMHLLEEDTGDFNFAFLRKYYPEGRIILFNLAIRQQGLIVPAGNPRGIQGVEDLKGRGLRYINRQRGAGTRILFDWHLRRAGLKPADVDGYAKEESTHMAVAVNVLTGAADCGMGIYAAARALGLDFVPLARERYDLAVPERFREDPRILAVRDMLQTDAFKTRLENLGGYETRLTGQIMRPGVRLGE